MLKSRSEHTDVQRAYTRPIPNLGMLHSSFSLTNQCPRANKPLRLSESTIWQSGSVSIVSDQPPLQRLASFQNRKIGP